MTTEEATLSARPNDGLAALTVDVPHSLDLEVIHDPLPNNQAHALILTSSARQSVFNDLAKAARILLLPRTP